MSVASAIQDLVKNGEHDAAIQLIEFDRKRRQQEKLTAGHQLHLSNPGLHKAETARPAILPTGEIRKLLEEVLRQYQAGYNLSSFDIYRELEIIHHKRNVFTERDLSVDAEGKPLWKKRTAHALKQLVEAGHLTKLSAKTYQVEVW